MAVNGSATLPWSFVDGRPCPIGLNAVFTICAERSLETGRLRSIATVSLIGIACLFCATSDPVGASIITTISTSIRCTRDSPTVTLISESVS